MKNGFTYGILLGTLGLLVSCGTSERFVQDDVYTMRTPNMPLGTDISDVTDYAAYVARKEQTREKTVYTTNSNNRFMTGMNFGMQMGYYNLMPGVYYSPYIVASPWGQPYMGMNPWNSWSMMNYPYYPYNNFLNPYTGFHSPYYNNFYGSYMGHSYPYYQFGYGGGTGMNYGYPYNGYGFGGYGGYGYGGNLWSSGSYYTPIQKPNTPANLARMSAGTSAGRYGMNTSGNVTYYTNEIKASTPTVGRAAAQVNPSLNTETKPESVTSRVNRPTTGRVIDLSDKQPAIVRPEGNTSLNRGEAPVRMDRNTNSVYNERVIRPESATRVEPAVRTNTGTTPATRTVTPSQNVRNEYPSGSREINNTPNTRINTPTRETSSPTMRSSSPSSGGAGSVGRSPSGTVNGGRR